MKISVYVVGSNPLPIAITLAYDLKLVVETEESRREGSDRLLFIFSKDTRKYFESIQKWLLSKGISPNIMDVIELESSDVHKAHTIYHAVLNKINMYDHISSIFLCANGGTKVMSVHTTMALMDAKKGTITITEADVDPETRKILLYSPKDKTDAGIWPESSLIHTVFKDCLTLNDIIALYRYQFTNGKVPSFQYSLSDSDSTYRFAEKIFKQQEGYAQFSKLFFDFKSFFNLSKDVFELHMFPSIKNLFTNDDKTWNQFRDFFEVKKVNRENIKKAADNFFEFCGNDEKCIELMKFFDNQGLIGDSITDNKVKFLVGKWLEEYIYSAVCEVLKGKMETGQCEVLVGCEMEPETIDGNTEQNNFEIDLVVRNGFTITFISCTTDAKKHLFNHKTLEVLSNADSLGMRTRTILASFLPKAQEVAERRHTGFSAQQYRNLKVLFYEDLSSKETLKCKLSEWLKDEI